MAIALADHYLVKFMARRPLPPRGTQLVMWSSPILLLVLVFTLTAHPTSASRRVARTPTQAHHRATTLAGTPTTASTTTVVTTTSTTVPPPRLSSGATSGATYAAPIATTAKSFAPDASANASSGVIAGHLTITDNVAVVPLDGPGTWTLAASHPLVAQLQCPSASTPVNQQITIDAPLSCQLELIATTATAWTLAPRP